MAWVALVVGLVLLFFFPRQMGVVIALAIAAGAGIYLYIGHQDRLAREAQDKVQVRVEYAAGKQCPPGQPLGVRVDNAGERTVARLVFHLEVRRPGHSGNLVQSHGAGTFHSDRIVKPGEGYAACHPAPKLRGDPALKDLEYAVAFKEATFAD